MSDTDRPEAPDPVDAAYVQAEALLSDEAARAARRARVLAAVAQDAARAPAPVPAPRPAQRDGGWRRGGWLVAACVAGLGLFVVTQIHAPPTLLPAPPAAPPPPATPSAAPVAGAAPPSAAPPPASETLSAPPRGTAPPATAAPPPSAAAPQPAPIEQPVLAVPKAPAPSPPPPAPPPPPPEPPADVRAARVAPPAAASAPGYASGGLAANSEDAAGPAAQGFARATVAPPPDWGAALRAAAAGGRTGEVESLLAQGAPVDAPDAAGDTALLKSVVADQPAVAALLRRHGASLDRRNHAGQNARDLAAARGDPALDQALGLAP